MTSTAPFRLILSHTVIHETDRRIVRGLVTELKLRSDHNPLISSLSHCHPGETQRIIIGIGLWAKAPPWPCPLIGSLSHCYPWNRQRIVIRIGLWAKATLWPYPFDWFSVSLCFRRRCSVSCGWIETLFCRHNLIGLQTVNERRHDVLSLSRCSGAQRRIQRFYLYPGTDSPGPRRARRSRTVKKGLNDNLSLSLCSERAVGD